jgi:hypothetical protein
MADNLTIDLPDHEELPYMVQRVKGDGTSFSDWDFKGDFGHLGETILSTMEDAIDGYCEESAPFYFKFLQIESFEPEPPMPLAFEIAFGFNEDRDQHVYQTSIDERVAVELGLHATDEGYDMYAEGKARFLKFGAALRELADKIDTEMSKAVIRERQDD